MSHQDIERTVDRVMKTHTRKASQFSSLKNELGLYFDEDEATRIAQETMKRLNPNKTQGQQISVEYIVEKARKEHKRKVSQFHAIKGDIAQYFPDENDATQLAAQVMKEYLPHNASGIREEVTVDSIVLNAVANHKRKVSTFRAIESDLGVMYDQEDVHSIAKEAMKAIFGQRTNEYMDEEAMQKRAERANKSRKESIVTPNIFGSDIVSSDDDDGEAWLKSNKRRHSKVMLDEEAQQKHDDRANKTRKDSIATPNIFGSDDSDDYMDDEALRKREKRAKKQRQDSIATPDIFADDYGDSTQQQIEDLEYELQEKDEEIERLKQIVKDISDSKTALAINSNRSLNQMREYLLKYQQTAFNI